MNTRSKSTLFLIEQLIVIAVFALCAAACIAILAHSFFTAEETRDMSNALLRAENAAEAFKATGGDLEKIADILGCQSQLLVFCYNGDGLVIRYDSNWQITRYLVGGNEVDYYLTIRLSRESSPYLTEGEIIVSRVIREILNGYPVVIENDPSSEILSFPVAARNSMIGGTNYE